jgi:hypothetical protein
VAVQTFLVKNDGDAEPRMFDEKFLDCVGEFRRFARIFSDAGIRRRAAGVARTTDLSDAVTFFKAALAFSKSKLPLESRNFVVFFLPDAHHLRGFFLERHAREQIFHAFLGRKARQLVGGKGVRFAF